MGSVYGQVVTHSWGYRELRQGRREEGGNAKAQRRRGEDEKGLVVAWRGMGVPPMTFHGRDARATWKAVRLPPQAGPFPPVTEGFLGHGEFC